MSRNVPQTAPRVVHLFGPGTLRCINRQLEWSGEGQRLVRLDVRRLAEIRCYGDVTLTSAAVHDLLRRDVSVQWLTDGGRRLHGQLRGDAAHGTPLRLCQHAVLSSPARLELARLIVGEKLHSQERAARHLQRHGFAVAGRYLAGERSRRQSLEQAGV